MLKRSLGQQGGKLQPADFSLKKFQQADFSQTTVLSLLQQCYFSVLGQRMSLRLRVDDRLDGHTNYNVWKERMQSIVEEAEAWDIMVHTTQNPVVVPTDAT